MSEKSLALRFVTVSCLAESIRRYESHFPDRSYPVWRILSPERCEPPQKLSGPRSICRLKRYPNPEKAVLASGLALTFGGASVILGVKPKLGATMLISFLAVASGAMHDFWNSEDAQEKQNHLIHFSKNMALLGACLALAGVEEPWPASLGD